MSDYQYQDFSQQKVLIGMEQTYILLTSLAESQKEMLKALQLITLSMQSIAKDLYRLVENQT